MGREPAIAQTRSAFSLTYAVDVDVEASPAIVWNLLTAHG